MSVRSMSRIRIAVVILAALVSGACSHRGSSSSVAPLPPAAPSASDPSMEEQTTRFLEHKIKRDPEDFIALNKRQLEKLGHEVYVFTFGGSRISDDEPNIIRSVGMPEVTLPVAPGMEGCHWPFRKARRDQWSNLVRLLLGGAPVKAGDAVGWLVDYAGPTEEAIQMTWRLATGGEGGVPMRRIDEGALNDIRLDAGVPATDNPATEAARKAISQSIRESCGVPLAEAIEIQARHSAGFMASAFCREGSIGTERQRTMAV